MPDSLPARRAILYRRISRDLERQGFGVRRQEDEGREVAARRGWDIVAVVTDNDTSAKRHDSREGWREMFRMIRAREAEAVIGWDMTRVLRNGQDRVDMLDLGKEYGVTISLIRGSDMDLTHSSGRFTADILGAGALQEIEQKSERQIAANLQLVKDGVAPRRRAFGYPGLDQRHGQGSTTQAPAETVAAEAATIRSAYDAILSGESVNGLTRLFAEHTTTRGGEWTRSKIRAALLNPRYAGLRAYRGQIAGQGTWDPLIPEETWRAAQAILANPDRRTNHRPSTSRVWLLAGLARCGVCDDGTTVRVSYRDDKTRIYRCRARAHLGRKADPIDAYVKDVVLAWAMSPEAADSIQDRERPDYGPLAHELGVLQLRLTQMTEDFAVGDLTREQLRAGTERARTRIGEIEHRLAHVDRSAVLADLIADPWKKWAEFSLDRRRRAIDMLMTVTVLHGRGGRPGGRRFQPETVRLDLKLG